MRFRESHRFQPVVSGLDLPHKDDLFHIDESSIPRKREDRIKFMKENHIFINTAWWSKQYQRCINGYTVDNAIEMGGDAIEDGVDAIWKDGNCWIPQYDLYFTKNKVHISGFYYFFLNFWTIYGVKEGTKHKGITKPRFLDHQFLFSQRLEMCEKQEKDDQEMKTRQLGVSEIIAALIAYYYLFHAASISIIVGGMQEDADHTFMNCDRGLDLLVNTQFYLERSVSKLQTSPLIKSKHTQSEIRALTAKDKPQSLSRFAPSLVVYEEIGKGKKDWSLDVSHFVIPSIYTNNIKTGLQIYIGTSGNMDEGAADLESRFYNPEKHNILSFNNTFESEGQGEGKKVGHFMAKWWFKIIDKDGNTQKKASIEKILEERKNIDPSKLYIHVSQNALYASEALQVSTAGYFGNERISALNRRRIEIKQHPEFQLERRGRLELKEVDEPITYSNLEFIPDKDGWLNIIEEPCVDKEGNVWIDLYGAGLDSYDIDEVNFSDSKGAMYIKKGYLPEVPIINTYVCEIDERPSVNDGGSDLFYYHTALACTWYRCKVNIEHGNNRIFTFYENNGFIHLLFERPRLAFANMIIKSSLNNRFGTDRNLKPQGLAILADRLTDEFIGNMFFIRQIEALAKFKYVPSATKKYNCDKTIATMECEVMSKETENIVARSQSDVQNKRKRRTFKTVNGRLVESYV